MITKSLLRKKAKNNFQTPRLPLIAAVTCCAVFMAGGHWREAVISSRKTHSPEASVDLVHSLSLRIMALSKYSRKSSSSISIDSGEAVHQRRKLFKEAKWRTKQDHMCPPGINLCIQHKQARDGTAADQAAQRQDLREGELAALREKQQQERLATEEKALARQASVGNSDQELMEAAQTSTFQNFMLRQHTPEARRDILKRRATAKRQHRAKALEYLRERLVEESQWEKAQVALPHLPCQYPIQRTSSSCATFFSSLCFLSEHA